jgi:hypothetical protein
MAGGSNAAIVPCVNCGGKAPRTSEGLETDWYVCSECGKKFGIDWDHDGPPDKPCWPAPEEDV